MSNSEAIAARPHILQVEDNPSDVMLTEEALTQSKWDPVLHVIKQVDDAISFLRQAPPHQDAPRPDLVLLDLNLPGSPGRELLKAIKDDPELRTIPVVILTSSVNPKDVQDAYSLHANAFLSKPMNFKDFTRTLEIMLDYWFEMVTLPG